MRSHYCDVTMQIVRANKDETFAKELQALWFDDLVRIIAMQDALYDIEDLKGDMYNPEHNPDIDPSTLYREEMAFESRVSSQGVYGLIGEYRDKKGTHQHADSCWGFVGEDYLGSGHDKDVAIAAIRAAKVAL